MTRVDIPAPYAAPVIAVCFLMLVDWINPNHPEK